MTLDTIIADIEAQLIARSVDAFKAILVSLIPSMAAFFLSPIGNVVWKFLIEPLVRKAAAWMVKQMDNTGYYLYKTKVNNNDASHYQDTIRNEKVAVESGDKDAIQKARAEKRAAFLKLFPLTA